MWSILWLFFVFDTPAKHPRIDPKERVYIEHSQGLLAAADDHGEVRASVKSHLWSQNQIVTVLRASRVGLSLIHI